MAGLQKESPGFSAGHHAPSQNDAENIAQRNKGKAIHTIVDSNHLDHVAGAIATALVNKFGGDWEKCKLSTFTKQGPYYVDIAPSVPGWILINDRLQGTNIVQYELKNLHFSMNPLRLIAIHAVPLHRKSGQNTI